jgi:hypothetical protein
MSQPKQTELGGLKLRLVSFGEKPTEMKLGPKHDTPNIDPVCTDAGTIVKWVMRLNRHELRAVASLIHQQIKLRGGA